MKYKTALNVGITFLISLIWIINGLYCKILDQVPRHEMIVSTILKTDHSRLCTLLIGSLEVVLGFWVMLGYFPKLTAYFQVLIILTMNTLEFYFSPDLLLWGRFNLFFAIILCSLIILNERYLRVNHTKA